MWGFSERTEFWAQTQLCLTYVYSGDLYSSCLKNPLGVPFQSCEMLAILGSHIKWRYHRVMEYKDYSLFHCNMSQHLSKKKKKKAGQHHLVDMSVHWKEDIKLLMKLKYNCITVYSISIKKATDSEFKTPTWKTSI